MLEFFYCFQCEKANDLFSNKIEFIHRALAAD